MWTPGHFRTVVDGWVDPEMSARVAGLQIQSATRDDDAPTSILSGEIEDQAQLIGVLTALHDLNLPIVEVTMTG